MDAAQLAHDHLVVPSLQFGAGLKAGKEISRIAHSALKVAYKLAQENAEAKLPTTLSCAIENILRLREEQAENDYAEAGIRKEQRERHEGRPEHDLDVVGRVLKAGM